MQLHLELNYLDWLIPFSLKLKNFQHILRLSLLLLIPEFILSVLIAKPLTIPFVKIFSKLNEPTEQNADLLGRIGKVVIGATDVKMGQADVNIDGSSYRLNIKTKNGKITRGESLLVVNYSELGKYYIVEPYETIN